MISHRAQASVPRVKEAILKLDATKREQVAKEVFAKVKETGRKLTREEIGVLIAAKTLNLASPSMEKLYVIGVKQIPSDVGSLLEDEFYSFHPFLLQMSAYDYFESMYPGMGDLWYEGMTKVVGSLESLKFKTRNDAGEMLSWAAKNFPEAVLLVQPELLAVSREGQLEYARRAERILERLEADYLSKYRQNYDDIMYNYLDPIFSEVLRLGTGETTREFRIKL